MNSALTLDELVERARRHKMTPAERHAQRVSLVMGLRADKSTLTREVVEEILGDPDGAVENHRSATKS